jgi:hypothetical protein
MTENDLYELVADYGQVYGPALRRDIYLARGVDWPRNWLEISNEIGEARAEALSEGLSTPTSSELQSLIRWQVDRALEDEDPALVATLWLCQKVSDDDVIAVEGWGASLYTELKFKLIGHYPDETSAIKDLRLLYIFSVTDL